MKERIKDERSSLLLFSDMTIFFFLFPNTNAKFSLNLKKKKTTSH